MDPLRQGHPSGVGQRQPGRGIGHQREPGRTYGVGHRGRPGRTRRGVPGSRHRHRSVPGFPALVVDLCRGGARGAGHSVWRVGRVADHRYVHRGEHVVDLARVEIRGAIGRSHPGAVIQASRPVRDQGSGGLGGLGSPEETGAVSGLRHHLWQRGPSRLWARGGDPGPGRHRPECPFRLYRPVELRPSRVLAAGGLRHQRFGGHLRLVAVGGHPGGPGPVGGVGGGPRLSHPAPACGDVRHRDYCRRRDHPDPHRLHRRHRPHRRTAQREL